MAAIAEALDGSRLVTLTGPPGIGKSRLALELARQVSARNRDGTTLVELAAVTDAPTVPATIASVLAIQEVPGQPFMDTLLIRLRDQRRLLVLDNCEHLIATCAEVVAALLAGCPHLRVLATSREPLTIAGEALWQVPPLSVPDPLRPQQLDTIAGAEAVGLFVDRASARQPPFELNAYVAGDVAEICRRLDGIPLAIELAAARVESLTPAEIARRLDDRFGLLTKGSRSALPRHQTLQAALDWSHDLLSAPERTLLRRLSVFHGGFCVEAVEAACVGGDVEPGQVYDLLAGLVAKSLVTAHVNGSPRARYRLLETIRAYAADRLEEAGGTGELREAHARFYVSLAERAEPELTGPDQVRWFERLDGERENLRRALEWALSHGRGDWAMRLTGSLVLFWRMRGHLSEGADLLGASLAGAESTPADLRAKVLWGAGFLAHMAGDDGRAEQALEDSLTLSRELGDRRGQARSLLILANCTQRGDDPRILAMLDESMRLAREAGDPWCVAHALAVAGHERAWHDELVAARPLFEECLAVGRSAQDKQGLRAGLLGLGMVAARQGDFRAAEPALVEAAAITAELGEDYSRGAALQFLGEVALSCGEYGRADELFQESLALVRETGPPHASEALLTELATVARSTGDRPRARRLLTQALERRSRGEGCLLGALQCMAQLEEEDGHIAQARRGFEEVLERARANRSASGTGKALYRLAELTRADGDLKRAAVLHNEALELAHQMGAAPLVAASLEAVAGLACAAGRHDHAARLFGVADALRAANGYARPPWESERYEADLDHTRVALSAAAFDTAFDQGSALSINDAVALATRGRGRRGRPASGWASLTDTEQHVAALVADGLTNPEIAERLFVSLATVKRHLSHVFTKLGIAGRRELAREVWRRNQR